MPHERDRPRARFGAQVDSRGAPHLGAALRLRRSLSGLSLDTASAEAVFRTDGRCLNAQGMAEPVSARETLRAAVVDFERVRARPLEERESPRAALLAGRWSLVDRLTNTGIAM